MPNDKYSHSRALRAYIKASLKASSRNLSSLVFGFLFPLIFIVLFGFMGGRSFKMEVGVQSDSDRTNPVFETLSHIETLKLLTDQDDAELLEQLQKGQIEAIISIQNAKNGDIPAYLLQVKTSNASQNGQAFVNMMTGISAQMNLQMTNSDHVPITMEKETIEGRRYNMIDFILPGQLGFIILGSGVIGTAFLLISLKQRLVVKRFFATPARRSTIILGESIARTIFALFQVTLVVLIGKFAFGFTLVNGIWTFLEILLICAIGLWVFLGLGLIISSIAKHEHSVPPISNLVTMPQFLLSGAFFSINVFPDWLQPLCRALPLTFVNDALRKVSFEGASWTALSGDVFGLAVWAVVIYGFAIKIFTWE